MHPTYMSSTSEDWERWRLCYDGGRIFRDRFLQRFARENVTEFRRRREMTPNACQAKVAIDEVASAICQRLSDVVRAGGGESYECACRGEDGGVDLNSSSMASFVRTKVVPELLVMGKVGIWVDMPRLDDEVTLADTKGLSPYLYAYKIEAIKNWKYLEGPRQGHFSAIELQDVDWIDDGGLPTSVKDVVRKATLEDGRVKVERDDVVTYLDLPFIPFVLLELEGGGLMKRVDGHQIALLNLGSADVAYATKSNFPFYVEQFDHKAQSNYVKPAQVAQNVARNATTGALITTEAGQAKEANTSKVEEVVVGAGSGRRYPIGANQPAFIHPSPEPLMASMSKQEQLEKQIRQQAMLSVTQLAPKLASAESKQQDARALENGLAVIGFTLEKAERRIAEFWAAYTAEPVASIAYPQEWTMRTDAERRMEAVDLSKQVSTCPSKTFQKELLKEIARLLVGHKVTHEVLTTILDEIDAANTMTAQWEDIVQDLENGLVSAETASKIRGYAPGEAEKAAVEHAERLARIAAAQGATGGPKEPGAPKSTQGVSARDPGAAGISDLSADPKAGAKERAQDAQKRGPGR